MAYANVASCVISIVGSFSNGLDVFKRLRDKKRRSKRPKKVDAVDERELRLSRSLRQGPEDIGREYQRSVYGAGQNFEIGDAIAHTSLAEIILRLNTGLVSIITSFLNHDKNGVELDYHSLTELSERSRIDTCRTLRQLFKRTTQIRKPLQIADRNRVVNQTHERSAMAPRKRSPRVKPTKVRGPMLAQVIIADSSKPPLLAMVRPGERRKKSTSSSSSLSKSNSESSTSLAPPLPTPPPEYALLDQHRPTVHRTQTAPEAPKPRRKQQSSANLPNQSRQANPDRLRATQSTSRLDTTLPPASFTHMAAMSTASLHPRRRKPTPTYYSIASGHTQIGEIPLHEWAEPYDFDQASMLNREAYDKGWPANQLSEKERRKKRFGLARLFGRK